MTTERNIQWYGVSPFNSLDGPKIFEKLKTATADEPAAVIRKDSRKSDIYVKTILSWEFLRELVPEGLVYMTNQFKGE